MNTKNTIITIMITFCLTITLFMILPIRSSNSPYDPWIDYNDDGTIGLSDLVMLANSYGTTGTPINKTELLLELQTTINTLNATITELQNKNTELENRMNQIKTIRFFEPNETYIQSVPRGDVGGPTATIATFTWTPNNSTCNAILDTCVYFECKGDPGWDSLYLKVDGQIIASYLDRNYFGIEGPDNYSQTIVVPTGLVWSGNNHAMGGIIPNQISYTFSVEIDSGATGTQGRLWTKNVSVVLTVIDGLPTS